MRNALIAMFLALAGTTAFASPAPPIGCPTCIQNTVTPQTAVINIGTATIRGTLTASTGTFVNLVITNLSVTNIGGNGSGLTALNASALGSGTVPSARVAGSYTGITGVGTIAAGAWNGTVVAPQYGGTGQNWVAVNRGALPFFNGTGTMSTLAAGTANKLLQANGAGADPTWTSAPTVLGTNVTAIPLANLVTGNLPAAIKATDASLVVVSGSKVSGDIGGNAANITGTLPLAQLGSGTLAADILAQNLVTNGVVPQVVGGPTFSAQITVNDQGLITAATQYAIPGVSTRAAWVDINNIWHGAPQDSISSWTFHGNVGIQGTLALTNALATGSGGTGQNWSATAAGGLPYFSGTGALGVLAKSVNGYTLTLSGGVPVWSAASSSATHLSGGATGSLPYQNAANSTAFLAAGGTNYVLTMSGGLPSWVAAASSATNIVGGAANSLPYQTAANTTSLLAAGSGVLQEVASGAPAWTLVPTLTGTNFSAIPLTALSAGALQTNITITTGNFTGGFNGASQLVQMTAGGIYPAVSGANITALTAANISAGTATGLNTTGNAATATLATTATNLAGGLIGQTPYQSAVGTTLFLPAMGAGGIVTGNGTSAAPSTGTFSGTPNQVVLTRTGSNIVLSTPQDINSGATPTFTATNLSGVSGITGLGTQAQALNMGSHLINNVTDPASAQDAATKNYVDTNLNGLDFKAAGRLATTAALPANSYSNGSSGVGATITGLSLGLLTIDGATPLVSDRVIVKDEGTTSHNGIYSVTVNGAGAFFILTRATDFNIASEMASGVAIFVTSGTTNSNTGWVTTSSVTTVGTDPVVFAQFTGLGDVTVGNGLVKSANTISVDPALNLTYGIVAASGTITSTFTVRGNGFSVGGSSFVITGGSATLAYQLVAGSINMSGSTSTIIVTSTIQAGAFQTTGLGISSSCTSGQYLGTQNVAGGIIVGGSCVTAGAGTITGSGTTGKVATFTGSTAIGDGSFFDSGAGAITIPATTTTTVKGMVEISSGLFVSASSTFTGNFTATGLVRISTGFAITFQPSAYTTTQTSFLAAVTGSTGSFTVVGTTVNCTLSGEVTNGGGTWFYFGVMVDGSFASIPGTTKDIGLSTQYPTVSGGGVPATFDFDFQVTPGAHSFALGIWTNSGTNTFPGSSSIGQFKCIEKHYRR